MERRRLNAFSFSLLPFLILFLRPFEFQNPIWLDVNSCHGNSLLHCCKPATVIICHTGYILSKGQVYLSVPMKIGVASGNEDNYLISLRIHTD